VTALGARAARTGAALASTGALAGLLLLCACGGSEPEPAVAEPQPTTGAEFEAPRPGMEVSGLMGTIPERKIRATLEPKLPKLARCFALGAEKVELVAGRMELYFRVALDGSVEWVYPSDSTVGDRATELCLLEVARAARFPGPKGGGAAEVRWSFEIDGSDLRPPVAWESERVAGALAENAAALEACGAEPSSVHVTAYVAPGGQVLSAGASASSHGAADHIECVLDAVRGFTLPDPGSYTAKVSFRAP
jgi:hypothetical protein